MPPSSNVLRKLGLTAMAAVAGVVLFELAGQLYAVRLFSQQRALRARPDHYFVASTNAVLAYELARNRTVEKEGRVLRLNAHGIRDDSDDVPAGETIALLGDSVTFGTGFSQDQTISARLQRELDPGASRFRVLNWGVPGYNLPELVEQLRVKNGIYRAKHVVYVLNPNDYCRRDTVYEGADNGLYRMYHPPRLKSPWFIRKTIYRFRKGGLISVDWYRWIYSGNREAGLELIGQMAEYCRAQGAGFAVVLLPAGCAYAGGRYQLGDLHTDIARFLQDHGITFADPVDRFAAAPDRFFTPSDHLTAPGNELMAAVIASLVQPP